MKIFNTLTMQKEEFKPLEENKVKIYACGPTVYNYFHLGNARPFIIFDTLRRYFEYRGYDVKFVQNFTDIDDKMINRANKEGITVKELADRFIGEYFTDAKALGIKEATVHPKATENIDAIIEIIKKLEERGFAYNVDGNVYFRTKKFDEYGKLSKQPLEDLEAGARIDISEQKEDAMDFALWKAQKEGEPAWESPWGMGRPGWHIECSAMANKYLGETIDLHSGGQDLIFPHHENEIAQSECANCKPFARYWMHNAILNIDNKKMSKSAGNFFTVRDISEKYDLQVLRFFMLSAHYRSPLNFSADLMEAAKNGLERIVTAAEKLRDLQSKATGELTEAEVASLEEAKSFMAKYEEAMEDDFNTADAISAIFEMVKFTNTNANADSSKVYVDALYTQLDKMAEICGLILEKKAEILDEEIEKLIQERQDARKAKNFARADEIRNQLLDQGIVLEDTREGVKWKRA